MALVEFYNLTGLSRESMYVIPGVTAAGLLFILSFLVASRTAGFQWLSLSVLVPVLLFIAALYSKKPDLIKGLAVTFLGIGYIVIPLSVMNYLVFPACSINGYTHRVVLGILAFVWINDTGAYLAGTLLGHHKLFPRISPKKSWEGLIGGAFLTLIPAFWMHDVMGILTKTDWIVLACIASCFGVYGDLSESWIKRIADKKDSGSIMPGHGGVLDRIDSILFVMPVSFIYLVIAGK